MTGLIQKRHHWSSICLSVTLFFGNFAFAQPARPADPLCVLDPAQMPASWRPSGSVQKSLSQRPWSARESKDAAFASRRGVAELNAFFAARKNVVAELEGDAVEPLIDSAYSASNMPDLRSVALAGARRNLAQLLTPVLKRQPDTFACADYANTLSYAIYAHTLYPRGDTRIAGLSARANAAFRACGSLAEAVGQDYTATFAAKEPSNDQLYDLVMWAIEFTNGQLVPGIELPAEARALPEKLWRYFESYPFEGADTYPEGASNKTFYNTAYLATHIAYIPTGYGRHALYISDSPVLYRFLRQNFYVVLEKGELDLVAEFVDLFRQYGCSEHDDLQTRDGSRYLLKLFKAAGNLWMAHREPEERAQHRLAADGGKVSDYNIAHKAWTGVAGVRVRKLEPPGPGTYGGIIRQWLKPECCQTNK